MAPIKPSGDVPITDIRTKIKKTKRGRRSEASLLKRKELHAQRMNQAGPSRELLLANRDAEVIDDEDEQVVIDPKPTTSSIPAAIIVDNEGSGMPLEVDADAIMEKGEDPSGGIFAPLDGEASSGKLGGELRRIPIPPHRMAPLKKEWVNIFTPLTEMLGLQVRMNLPRKAVEMRTSKHTKEVGAIQKGADFVRAFTCGFLIADAIALLRLDDLYLDSFEIKDVKSLSGDHLSRAIGRIAGQDGKTRYTIENATRTRVILADTKVHILGSFQNIKLAKDAIVALILGSPPGKVYASLRTIGARLKQRAV